MKLRNTAAALLVVGLVTIPLTACSKEVDAKNCVTEVSPAAAAAEQAVDVTVVEDESVPAVTGAFGETPVIAPGTGEAPTVITAKVLQAGTGEKVTANDTVTINYAGQLWDGTPFDSSFERGEPATFPLNNLIKGWKWGLADRNVGDRVELVIPSEWGYGDAAQGDKIPAGSTLVFVVDIIGTVHPWDGKDLSALKGAKATDEKLPKGITIACPLGAKPEIEIKAGLAEPTQPQTLWVAEGSGATIESGMTLEYLVTFVTWDGQTRASSWDGSGEAPVGGTAAPADQLGAVGHTVGSRVIQVIPSEPSMVAVMDIVAAY
ncbi:MAG: FKBP-type peptidyl-prolyl cis-trans isomerase [Actinomycetaceae bacterium]|nr:FKBP-type peptidyl-prolyl cis-trans isomerase [Actinomycetaceae bacterium]